MNSYTFAGEDLKGSLSKIKEYSLVNRGWVKKKCTNGFKSGGNILGQSALKC